MTNEQLFELGLTKEQAGAVQRIHHSELEPLKESCKGIAADVQNRASIRSAIIKILFLLNPANLQAALMNVSGLYSKQTMRNFKEEQNHGE